MSRKRDMDRLQVDENSAANNNTTEEAGGKGPKIMRCQENEAEEEKADNGDDTVDPPARERPAVRCGKIYYHLLHFSSVTSFFEPNLFITATLLFSSLRMKIGLVSFMVYFFGTFSRVCTTVLQIRAHILYIPITFAHVEYSLYLPQLRYK
jgi:hypothetical protein